jgi:hypothetical protein
LYTFQIRLFEIEVELLQYFGLNPVQTRRQSSYNGNRIINKVVPMDLIRRLILEAELPTNTRPRASSGNFVKMRRTNSNNRNNCLTLKTLGPPLLVFNAHEDSVIQLEYLPYSNNILSAGLDGAARVWNLQGKCVGTIGGANVTASVEKNSLLSGVNAENEHMKSIQNGGTWGFDADMPGKMLDQIKEAQLVTKRTHVVKSLKGWVANAKNKLHHTETEAPAVPFEEEDLEEVLRALQNWSKIESEDPDSIITQVGSF